MRCLIIIPAYNEEKNIAICLSWATPDLSNRILKLLGANNSPNGLLNVTDLLNIESKLPALEIAFQFRSHQKSPKQQMGKPLEL
jgi:hypothetical protein